MFLGDDFFWERGGGAETRQERAFVVSQIVDLLPQ